MPTTREQVLVALLARLETVPTATVKREAPLPETVPAGGLIILRDGDPGDPEVLLSPPANSWQHQAEIEVIVSRPSDEANDALDDLLMAVGQALAADRSLDALADWLDWGAAKTSHLAIDGAAGLKGAVVPVRLPFGARSTPRRPRSELETYSMAVRIITADERLSAAGSKDFAARIAAANDNDAPPEEE